MKKFTPTFFKLFSVTCLLTLLIITSANADKEFSSSTKIAVIDFAKITNEAKSYKSLTKSATEKRQSIEDELSTVNSKLKKRRKDLLAKQDNIDKKELAELVEEYNQDYIQKTSAINERKLKVKSAYKEATNYINKEIKDIVGEIAEAKGFDIAVQKGLLTFSKDNLDITEEVMSSLDKKIKTISIDE